ncbi:2-pyrone-4,6-dicarbaxylate hydrolase [Vreelandella titanicae]
MSDATGYMQQPSKPRLWLPEGACDCHTHVFGPQSTFPYADNALFRPQDAPKEALFALHKHLGIDRCVIVQSGCHGFDNSAMLDAMRSRPGQYLGVALAPVDISDAHLAGLAEQGVRGVRFNFMPHLDAAASPEEIVAFSHRLARHGMHLQVHMHHTLIERIGQQLSHASTAVVIDHMGRIEAAQGSDQDAFNDLMKLMENDKFLVKVSGCDRASALGSPYSDAVPFAQALVKNFPDRVLWGTDWPHPNIKGGTPDDGVLVDILESIAPDPLHRKALLVDNPAWFYGF